MRQKLLRMESEYQHDGLRAILLLPETAPRRLLTLLHGAGEGPETVLENFDLASIVDGRGLAVLLPTLGNSFCLDWGAGMDTRAALLCELLPAAQAECGIPAVPGENVVGGISMGGYAAISLALEEPERFCAAFSLSGALSLKKSAQLLRICGLRAPTGLGERADARTLLEKSAAKPPLYLDWGDGDWFLEENRAFARRAAARGIPVRAVERPGLHNWALWRQSLGPAVEWAAETARTPK